MSRLRGQMGFYGAEHPEKDKHSTQKNKNVLLEAIAL